MAKRVFDTLGRWTTLDDDALDAAIGAPRGRCRARGGRRRGGCSPARWTRRAGSKCQTIHAFCTQLLHQFPFEANVAARFTVLDETAQMQLLEELTLAALLEGASATRQPARPRAGHRHDRGRRSRPSRRGARGDQSARRDHQLAHARRQRGGGDRRLSRALGVAPEETLESVEALFFTGSLIPPLEWPAIAAVLSEGDETDCEQARRFATLTTVSGTNRIELYLEIFCTDEGNPRNPS